MAPVALVTPRVLEYGIIYFLIFREAKAMRKLSNSELIAWSLTSKLSELRFAKGTISEEMGW